MRVDPATNWQSVSAGNRNAVAVRTDGTVWTWGNGFYGSLGNGILTTEDDAQAWARARVSEGDKGGGAANACLRMIAVHRQLLGAR